MTYKPSDFLFGIMEFLAFIVPGMILYTTLPKIICWEVPSPLKIVNNDNIQSIGWVAFFMLSYIFGHFIHHISALILNPIYNRTYYRNKRIKHASFVENAEKQIRPVIPQHVDLIRVAEAYVRCQQPSLIPELEKYEANSKLFRALTLLCIYLCFYPTPNIWLRIILIAISLLSFSKFANQRWTHRLMVYEYFSILNKPNTSIKNGA